MKKFLLILSVLAFLSISCKDEDAEKDKKTKDVEPTYVAAGSESTMPKLFEYGVWTSEVGGVSLISFNDGTPKIELENYETELTAGKEGYFIEAMFDDPIDISSYKRMVFTGMSDGNAWHGGKIFYLDDEDNVKDAGFWNGSGFPSGMGDVEYTLTNTAYSNVDFTKVIGFNIKTTGTLTIDVIEFK